MKNAQYHTLDIKTVCENKLRINFKQNKECNGWYVLNGKKTARITIPKGRKPIPKKTYKSMAKQLKLNISQFDLLLECPLTHDKYVAILSLPKQIDNSKQ